MNRIIPLAGEYEIIERSPSPQDIYCYSPGILALPGGRLVATMDFGGPGTKRLENSRQDPLYPNLYILGQVLISDDGGKSWKVTAHFPFYHARPFLCGNSIYVLGHCGDLRIIRSDDQGESWSDVSVLTQGQLWHQAPSNVWYANNSVYLVMERITKYDTGWPVHSIAPVLMRGRIGENLLLRENWVFASELTCSQAVEEEKLEYHGIQFYDSKKEGGKYAQPLGWLEAQVIQFLDPDDIFTDPEGHTFHLFLRTNSGIPNMGAMLKVHEAADGSMTTSMVQTPSGKKLLFLPIPGGHLKFHILWDGVSGYYWLVSNQCTDGLKRYDSMPQKRGDPINERHRLALYFSKNAFDWCFAGIVALTEDENCSRSYASMAIDGNDLVIASRSGDIYTKNSHDTNLITFHRIQKFRELIY
ncbi:MAG: sialidase family protein [Hydrogeniiclostridium sp.]